MISIADYCWRLGPVPRPGLTIVELDNMAKAIQPRLFLAWDPLASLAVLVVPDLVFEVLREQRYQPDAPLAGSPLADELSRGQLSMPADTSAREAVGRIEVAQRTTGDDIVTVVALATDGSPAGLFVPSVVLRRFTELADQMELLSSAPEVARGVAERARRGGLGDVLSVLDATFDSFHSEALNSWAPDPRVCQDHGRSHITSRCPCKFHPSAACGARDIT